MLLIVSKSDLTHCGRLQLDINCPLFSLEASAISIYVCCVISVDRELKAEKEKQGVS